MFTYIPHLATATSRRLAAMRADYAFVLTDALVMVVSWFLARALTAGDLDENLRATVWMVVAAPCTHLVCNAAFGLYGRIWRQAGIEEARRLLASGLVMTLVGGLVAGSIHAFSYQLAVLGPLLATFLSGLTRFRSRLFAWQRRGPGPRAMRLAVVGAGKTGVNLVRELVDSPTTEFVPVAIADDDRRLAGRHVKGVPVIGGLAELPAAAVGLAIDQIILAVPTADQRLVQRAAAVADALGVPLKVMPSVPDLVAGRTALSQVRKPMIEDLLGRHQVETDLEAVRHLVEGRSVLLTGAGGSIGAEIARQVSTLSPSRLLLLDHDETHLYDTSLSISPSPHTGCLEVLADIRDAQRVDEVFETFRPDIVFHAAAHKHVPILEAHPLEGIATNVFGTLNLLEAARRVGCERFVLISTDKAVRPRNVLGATKRLAELLLESHVHEQGRYCAVRFGNVLGSRGSVVPTFERQIAAGGPVTVTDAHMTRYFMSIVEAVQLVLQASVFTDDNDLFVLEMGSPVRIMDLARLMVRLSGHTEAEIPIHVTGSRPGEKTHEELHSMTERVTATRHPAIARIQPDGLSLTAPLSGVDDLRELVRQRRAEEARTLLFSLVAPQGGEAVPVLPLPRVGSPTLGAARSSIPRQAEEPVAAKGALWSP